jgi:hypothetical protein
LAEGLVAVAARLEAKDAGKFVGTFTQVMAQTTDSSLLDRALNRWVTDSRGRNWSKCSSTQRASAQPGV